MAHLLRTLHGIVEAPVDRVAEVLLDVPAQPGVTVERSPGAVAVQGGWWFRGETSLAADPRGTAVTYRILDVAPQGRWATWLVSRGPLRAAPAAFAARLADAGRRLNCRAYPVTAA